MIRVLNVVGDISYIAWATQWSTCFLCGATKRNISYSEHMSILLPCHMEEDGLFVGLKKSDGLIN